METQGQATSRVHGARLPIPFITTSRLIVRNLHPRDAASMQRHANDPEVLKYMSLSFSYPYTLSAAEAWIATQLVLSHQIAFALCRASSPDVVVGGIGFKPGSDTASHTAEVGFWIGKKFWRQGYMTEALEAFTKWIFESWKGKDGQRIMRLWGKVWSPNAGSMRCFEKCGYEKEGVLRDHCENFGEVWDVYLFGLLKKDWERRIQAAAQE